MYKTQIRQQIAEHIVIPNCTVYPHDSKRFDDDSFIKADESLPFAANLTVSTPATTALRSGVTVMGSCEWVTAALEVQIAIYVRDSANAEDQLDAVEGLLWQQLSTLELANKQPLDFIADITQQSPPEVVTPMSIRVFNFVVEGTFTPSEPSDFKTHI